MLQAQANQILPKIMEMSSVVSEIEGDFHPMNLAGLSPQEIENILKTMDNIIRACRDVKRYLS